MKTIAIPIYYIGKEVTYQEYKHTVERVVISGYNIFLTLNNKQINAKEVWVEPTIFALERI